MIRLMAAISVEGHRPAMGWWDGNGFHAACECGWESGPCPGLRGKARRTAETRLAEHLDSTAETGVVVIDQEPVEAEDDTPVSGLVPYNVFPEGF
jgi:hypothetical protein